MSATDHHPCPTQLPGWAPAACSAWAAGHRVQAVQATLAALNRQTRKDPRLVLQASYYLYQMGDIATMAQLLEHHYRAQPEHTEMALNLGVAYLLLGRHADGLALYRRVLETEPDRPSAWDGLCTALLGLGRHAEAAAAGTRSLQLKHLASQPPAAGWRLPRQTPQALAQQTGKRDVICFSLWGQQLRYLRGALRNVLLAPDIYPGWTVQFHVDSSVPHECLRLLERLGAEVIVHPDGQPLRDRLCWRFAAANDPGVGRFLVRDADSVISTREALAVQHWVESDRHFHVLRDWWNHCELMLAGMWGGVAGVLPDLAALLATYTSPAAETSNIDQWFLRDAVWGMVHRSCLVHDRCFTPEGALPMPGPTPLGERHIGENEYAARRDWQAQWLAPWIAAHACLRSGQG